MTLAKEVQLHFSLDHIHLSLHDQTLGGIKLKGDQLRFALSKGRHTALDSKSPKVQARSLFTNITRCRLGVIKHNPHPFLRKSMQL